MLERLKRRIPDAENDALLRGLLSDAEQYILAYTGREELPEALESLVIELAAILYNRLGMEGEQSHREDGIARIADAVPEEIRRQLNPYRLVRGVG